MRALFSTEGVRGTAMEAAWITTHLAMYPLGLVRESTLRGVERHRLDHLPPEQRGLLAGDIEAAGTPIVLVHGLVDNRSIFAVLSSANSPAAFTGCSRSTTRPSPATSGRPRRRSEP